MAGESTAGAVEDMLRVEREAISKMRQELRDLIEEIKEERKEMHQLRELQKDMVAEYDRLTERVSTQLKALVQSIDHLERLVA